WGFPASPCGTRPSGWKPWKQGGTEWPGRPLTLLRRRRVWLSKRCVPNGDSPMATAMPRKRSSESWPTFVGRSRHELLSHALPAPSPDLEPYSSGFQAPLRGISTRLGLVTAGPSFDAGRIFVVVRGNLAGSTRSEEHTSELQSRSDLVCRLLLEKKKKQ